MTEIEIPKIKRTVEVGEIPFQLLEVQEEILQGWNPRLNKTMYLFKSDLGNWAYYDRNTNMVVEVGEWKDRAAHIAGDWVKMTKYFRVAVQFLQPILYTTWDGSEKKNVQKSTEVAILTITKTAFDHLMVAKEGRPEESWYRFQYKVVS